MSAAWVICKHFLDQGARRLLDLRVRLLHLRGGLILCRRFFLSDGLLLRRRPILDNGLFRCGGLVLSDARGSKSACECHQSRRQ